jgi:hypothetical protein
VRHGAYGDEPADLTRGAVDFGDQPSQNAPIERAPHVGNSDDEALEPQTLDGHPAGALNDGHDVVVRVAEVEMQMAQGM